MSFILKIYIGYLLDLIFGDPIKIPHPVQIIGGLISYLEKLLYKKKNKILMGLILWIIVIVATYFITHLLSKIWIIEVYLIYTIFASRSLEKEAKKIYHILKKDDLALARKEISYIVSRDTDKLDKKSIIRSTMETVSENIVDGVISPMFYLFIGGVPLAMTYKAINTIDSMIGYKNEKYMDFGYFGARLDDLANFIPARITGLILIPLSAFILRYNFFNSIKIFFRDRKNHASPNSAHPESAVAGALGIQFGGKTSYFGELKDKPTIGDKINRFKEDLILKNIKIMYLSGFIGLITFSFVYWGINGFTWG